MKKIIALIMVCAFLLPNLAFAGEENAKNLEEVIIKVREKIEVPESYDDFSSNMRTDEDGVIHWNLSWASAKNKDDWDKSYISVDVTGGGFIESYSKYDNSGRQYSEYVKIPDITKQEADDIVNSFIAKVCPEIAGEYEYAEPRIYDGNYSYNFIRVVNGIKMPSNQASFNIDSRMKEITNYYGNWNVSFEFPSPEKAISKEEAQNIFADKTPLDLEYRIDSDGKPKLQYSRSREKGNMYINAITGEIEKPEFGYGIYTRAENAKSLDTGGAMGGLRPEEQQEVDKIATALTVEQAEEKLRQISELDFDESYILSSSHLYQYKQANGAVKANLSLYFTQLKTDEKLTDEQLKVMIAAGHGDGYANADFDAQTGDLTSFSSGNWYGKPRPMSEQNEKESQNTEQKAIQKIAESFINKMRPGKIDKVKYIPADNQNDEIYYYNYYRMENGAYFGNDSIWIGVNADNSKIKEFSYNWTEGVEIPSADSVIGLAKAHEILFEADAFKMQYVPNKGKVILAYKLSDEKTFFIDANNGQLLDWSGKPLTEDKAPEFSDIEGHFSEKAIKELAMVGVFLSGDEFLPDSNMLQKDFVTLLIKLGKYYYDKENIDTIYGYLIREGIMDESEKNPDGTITRENAVKYVMRYLGYKKFAEIPGIFKTDFADADEISPDLLGYAAIAKGLGVVNGNDGNFMPKDILTKGEAVVIIYNCIKSGI
ncbi:MAG: S-layer homology domain-containing protein [Firmicutes bacterium]|nr:S-layer homology domain-containing protein [Bacillota bacterium]